MILFCLSNVDPSACTFDTAVARLNGPPAGLEQCMFSSETVVAAHPHAILGNQYAKVLCESRHARS